MKHFLILLISVFVCSGAIAQEKNTHFVKASKGLIIRKQPDLNAERIGKLHYGKIIEVLEETNFKLQIMDNGDTLNGVWLKIKFDNFPFICSDDEKLLGDWNLEGYVFSGYLEKLQKAHIETTTLDSVQFNSLFVSPKPYNPLKITSIDETKKLLGPNVKWKYVAYLGDIIAEIKLDNGQICRVNLGSYDVGFLAYYPNEHIILFEGGHSSEFSFSLKTGEVLETVGNPEYIIESPNQKVRLNGWFPGQECSSYFFQEKSEDGYRYLVEFGFGSTYGDNVCYFEKFCWINDYEFIYSNRDHSMNSQVGEEKYFKGKLITP
ncbi:MAG: SH3 domain-containing protein [Putridiphycobacter sp.]